MFEGATAGEVKDHNNAQGLAIVGSSDGSKPFLSCCIPNLGFDNHFVHDECFDGQLDSDGGF